MIVNGTEVHRMETGSNCLLHQDQWLIHQPT